MISLTIENLTKRFGDIVALDGIDLAVAPGEIFFLLGPSGCGKTTLLRCIAGFCLPESGRIRLGDEDVTKLPPHRRNTGMMFQSYALWPHMTVAKNVAFGLEERKVPRTKIREQVSQALESVRMDRYADRKINELSGGQQQRVALARALVIRPRCLLLDEPLSNLDAKLRLEMRGEIRRICQEFGLTAIYVTHDQKEALSIADRMAILEDGHVRQVGKPDEVYRHPQSRFVADFMGETNFIPGRIVGCSDAAAVRVETEIGSFYSTLEDKRWRPAVGENCVVSIRPEAWRLGAGGGAENSVSGRIRERIYLGEMAQYQFATAGQSLKVFELNPRLVDVSADREFTVTVEPPDVIILPP